MRLPVLLALSMSVSMTASAACDAPEFHHFDFWIGDWNVTAPEGTPNAGTALGHNRIEAVVTGCGLLENWTGASGFTGKSLNSWDARHHTWRQFWVGSDGNVLQLAGALEGKAMVMTGETPVPGGGVQRQRITWTPQADGSVLQHWETSGDAGATWATSFLGLYRRSATK